MPLAKAKKRGKIHYDCLGSGPPVALIAGMGGAASYWRPQIELFSKRFQLVLHDQRGSGQSSKDKIAYSVDLMADDLLAVLDDAKLDSAHLVGHAAGAAIAMCLALKHPERVRSLVLFGAWARIDPYFRRVFEIRKDLLVQCGRLAYVRAMPLFLNPPAWVSRNIAALEADEPAMEQHLSPTEILLARIDAFCAYEPAEALARISCPAFVCAARDDHLVPLHCADELVRLIPDATSHYFESGGHAVSQVEPATFNKAVLSFLDAAARSPRRSARAAAGTAR